jgi:antitoxin component HigA of HigAB toxin-antitoxin module
MATPALGDEIDMHLKPIKTEADHVGIIGNRTRVYEVLRRDRALSLAMIRRLNKQFRIPAEVLIRPVRIRRKQVA